MDGAPCPQPFQFSSLVRCAEASLKLHAKHPGALHSCPREERSGSATQRSSNQVLPHASARMYSLCDVARAASRSCAEREQRVDMETALHLVCLVSSGIADGAFLCGVCSYSPFFGNAKSDAEPSAVQPHQSQIACPCLVIVRSVVAMCESKSCLLVNSSPSMRPCNSICRDRVTDIERLFLGVVRMPQSLGTCVVRSSSGSSSCTAPGTSSISSDTVIS